MTSVLHKDLMVWQKDVLNIRRKELDLQSGDVCSRLESAYYIQRSVEIEIPRMVW